MNITNSKTDLHSVALAPKIAPTFYFPASSERVTFVDKSQLAPDTDTMATVSLTSEAARQLDRLPKAIHGRVVNLLERLKQWPEISGAKPLRGELTGYFRLRTGDYRLLFHVAGDTVTVDKIAHRSKFYER